jgi:hypothetical protein
VKAAAPFARDHAGRLEECPAIATAIAIAIASSGLYTWAPRDPRARDASARGFRRIKGIDLRPLPGTDHATMK